MIAAFEYPDQREAAENFIAENQPCHVWHDGAIMRVYTGSDIPQDIAEG